MTKLIFRVALRTLLAVSLLGLNNWPSLAKGPERPILEEGELRSLFEAVSKRQKPFDAVVYNGVPMALGEDTVKPTGVASVRLRGNTTTTVVNGQFQTRLTKITDLDIEASQKRSLPLRYRILGPFAPKPTYHIGFNVYPDGTISPTNGWLSGFGSPLKQTWSSVTLSRLASRVAVRPILEGLLKVLRK